jgi:UDP-N-acetylmuramoylalanine--D-glutamate ligase
MDKIVILGGGESGVGAAILAKERGSDVWVSDKGPIRTQYKKELAKHGIPFEEGQHTEESFFDATYVVKSPGIPPWVATVKRLEERAVPIISEIEFAWKYAEGPIIAITGSNGKTTTTALAHHLLTECGVNASVGGNIGKSFARLVAENSDPEVFVLEISSFQLDDSYAFRPNVAVLLNITPDHLDRYDYSMDAYATSKLSLAQNQISKDLFIYNREDDWSVKSLEKHRPESIIRSFGLEKGGHAWMEGNILKMASGSSYDTSKWKIIGPHNKLNAMAALLAIEGFFLKEEKLKKAFSSFSPMPHRLETIGMVAGVDYVNDSKATNVDSVKYALEAIDKPIIWIAGGVDKGNDYGPIRHLVEEKVKKILVLGDDVEKFLRDFSKDVKNFSLMKNAVKYAAQIAQEGDAVLLSPACASFDLFRNYEDRGDQFKQAVNELSR